MGIQNLLKELAPAAMTTHLAAFANRTVAVDAMCWLHRSAFTCATELVRCEMSNSGLAHPTRYLYWLRRMARMLRHFDITPLFVFDGGALPAKEATNTARDAARAAARQLADQLYDCGQLEEAADAYGKCITITSTMRRNFLHLLRTEGFESMIAPYEADAQIGYLYRRGLIHAAITEDSDLLPFGCRRILIKLDREGNCKLIDLDTFEKEEWSSKHYPQLYKLKRILQSSESANTAAATNKANIAAASSSNAVATPAAAAAAPSSAIAPASVNFIHACVLSGCDYLSSLHGIGVKKAIGWVHDYPRIETLLHYLKANRKKLEEKWRKDREKARKKAKDQAAAAADPNGLAAADDGAGDDEADHWASKLTPVEYELQFFKAVLAFQHQLVFDPTTRTFQHLTPLPPQLARNMNNGPIAADGSSMPAAKFMSPPPPHFIDLDAEAAASEVSDSSELPSSHPLLGVRDFSFLGPPIPAHLVDAFLRGTIDPKTLQPYPPGFEVTDLAQAEQAARTKKHQHQGEFRRNASALPAANATTASTHKRIAAFFRSTSTPAVASSPSMPHFAALSRPKPANMKPTRGGGRIALKPQHALTRFEEEDADQWSDIFADDEPPSLSCEADSRMRHHVDESDAEPNVHTTTDANGTQPDLDASNLHNSSEILTPPPLTMNDTGTASTTRLNPFAVSSPITVATFADSSDVLSMSAPSTTTNDLTPVRRPLSNIANSNASTTNPAAAPSFLARLFNATPTKALASSVTSLLPTDSLASAHSTSTSSHGDRTAPSPVFDLTHDELATSDTRLPLSDIASSEANNGGSAGKRKTPSKPPGKAATLFTPSLARKKAKKQHESNNAAAAQGLRQFFAPIQ